MEVEDNEIEDQTASPDAEKHLGGRGQRHQRTEVQSILEESDGEYPEFFVS